MLFRSMLTKSRLIAAFSKWWPSAWYAWRLRPGAANRLANPPSSKYKTEQTTSTARPLQSKTHSFWQPRVLVAPARVLECLPAREAQGEISLSKGWPFASRFSLYRSTLTYSTFSVARRSPAIRRTRWPVSDWSGISREAPRKPSPGKSHTNTSTHTEQQIRPG